MSQKGADFSFQVEMVGKTDNHQCTYKIAIASLIKRGLKYYVLLELDV